MAERHMGQGSQVVYITHPVRSMVPSAFAAARMALTSAWAVGSVVGHTVLWVQDTTLPSLTTAAPDGELPAAIPSRVLAMACCMYWDSDAFVLTVSFSPATTI